MNHPCITEVTTQLGNGVKEITGTPGYMSCGAAGVREPPNYEKAVRLGARAAKNPINVSTIARVGYVAQVRAQH